jgi:hypothetical protein
VIALSDGLMRRCFPLCFVAIMAMAGCANGPGALPKNLPADVDFLDYFLQRDDVKDAWTLGGTDVRPDRDPDGGDARTFVLNKFSSAGCYEVYKVTGDQVQIRYEVMRAGNKPPGDSWVRRFEGIDAHGAAPGAIWCNRHIHVGGEPVLFRWRQDHLVFDAATQSYVVNHAGCSPELSSYVSFVWAMDDWRHNRSGMRINPVLRLISEWQHEGLMVEMYDYAKGKGPVAWRWLERVSTLRPMEGDRSGKMFHCENGYVYVASPGDGAHEPAVFMYDPKHERKGRRLEVVKFTSRWKPELGPQWYVIDRDSVHESALKKREERIAHDFSLPEWKGKSGATIADLPYVFTHCGGLVGGSE